MYGFGVMALLGLAVLVVAKIGNRYLRLVPGHGHSRWWRSASGRPG